MDILYASLSMTVDESGRSARYITAFCLQLLREIKNNYSISRNFDKLLTKLNWFPRATGYNLQSAAIVTVSHHPTKVVTVLNIHELKPLF